MPRDASYLFVCAREWARASATIKLDKATPNLNHQLNNQETDVPTAPLNSVSSGDEMDSVLSVLFGNYVYRTRNEPSLPRMKRGKSLILLGIQMCQVLAYFHFVLLFYVLRGITGGSLAKNGDREGSAASAQKHPFFPLSYLEQEQIEQTP
jgi:hypothetical protein